MRVLPPSTSIPEIPSLPEGERYPTMDSDPKKHKHKLMKICISLTNLKKVPEGHFFMDALMGADYGTLKVFADTGVIVKLAPKTKLNKDLVHIGYEFYQEFLDTRGNTLEMVRKRKHWKRLVNSARRGNKFIHGLRMMIGALTGKYTTESFKEGLYAIFR